MSSKYIGCCFSANSVDCFSLTKEKRSGLCCKNPLVITSMAIGAILSFAGIFIVLAALQVLPHGVNAISQLGIGGKIAGGIIIGLGLCPLCLLGYDQLSRVQNKKSFDRKTDPNSPSISSVVKGVGNIAVQTNPLDVHSPAEILEDFKEHPIPNDLSPQSSDNKKNQKTQENLHMAAPTFERVDGYQLVDSSNSSSIQASQADVSTSNTSSLPVSWNFGQDGFDTLVEQYKAQLLTQLLLKYGLVPSTSDIDLSKEKKLLDAIPSHFEWKTNPSFWGKRLFPAYAFSLPTPQEIGSPEEINDEETLDLSEKLYYSAIEKRVRSNTHLFSIDGLLLPLPTNAIPSQFLHGTSQLTAQTLIDEGFKEKYKTDYILTHGLGVYLAITTNHARSYAKEEGVILTVKVKPCAKWATLLNNDWNKWKIDVLETKIEAFLINEFKKIQPDMKLSFTSLCIRGSALFRHLYAELAKAILASTGYDAFFVKNEVSFSLSGDKPLPDFVYLSSANLVEFVAQLK